MKTEQRKSFVNKPLGVVFTDLAVGTAAALAETAVEAGLNMMVPKVAKQRPKQAVAAVAKKAKKEVKRAAPKRAKSSKKAKSAKKSKKTSPKNAAKKSAPKNGLHPVPKTPSLVDA